MATSSIPTVKANLVTQLRSRPALARVQVSYGAPLPNPEREFIWVGEVEGTQDWATFATAGGVSRHEAYRLTVVIWVSREGRGMQKADERCFALYAELENQLRGDVTVNGAVTDCKIGDFLLREFVGPDGTSRSSELSVKLDCEHWI